MAHVLITGATGLLGSTLAPFLRERGHQVVRLGYTKTADFNANLISYEQTARALNRVEPEVIINLVSLTNVDRCETHPHEAYLLNVKPVENICAWMRMTTLPCHLIQISSDQVYDGAGPHSEDKLTIRNCYAMSKLAGEFAAGIVPSTILRTNFFGRSLNKGRSSFTDWVYEALCGKVPVKVFNDVMFSPLAISTLCDCIECCIIEKPLGVFNLGSRDGMSKANFTFAFASALGQQPTNLVPINYSSVVTLVAQRPSDMRLNCERIETRLGIKLPRLIDEIELIARDYC